MDVEPPSTAGILGASPVIDPIMPVLAAVDGQQLLAFPDSERYFAVLSDHSRLRGSVRN